MALYLSVLNPQRISPPDIDVDLCHRGRREVLEYIRERFGREHIAHVGAFSTLQARAVLRDTGRALDLDYKKIDRMCSFIPYSRMSLEQAESKSPYLSAMIRQEVDARRAFEAARCLQGLPRHMTQHSAGVVIAKKPLTEYVPLQRASGDEIITQADMDMLEDLGLVKIDLLGLRFLTVIGDTLKLVHQRHNIKLSACDIPPDDLKTYNALAQGDTTSTFQLESSGMRNLLKKIRPKNIEDLSAVLALYRPGPLQSGMTEEFIARRQGKKDVSYPHPCLKPVLSSTYGVFVYQEQLMQAAHAVAGYTLGEADLLRRAIAKKNKKDLEKQRPEFIQRARMRGIDHKTSQHIFSVLEAFGDYGFNKAHSICYAVMAYRTVFLKEHFPLEYFSALLSLYMDTPSRLQLYLSETRRKGISLLRPDINKSSIGFSPENAPTEPDKFYNNSRFYTDNRDELLGAIRTGFAMIKNLGPKGITEILKVREEKPFTGFFNFCRRIDNRAINIRALESLILAGAFDSFNIPRPALLLSAKPALMEKQKHQGQISLFPEESPIQTLAEDVVLKDFSREQKIHHEFEYLGHFITRHPMEFWEETARNFRTHTIAKVLGINHKKKVRLVGIMLDTRFGRTRSGNRMMFILLEDLTGSVELVVFPRQLRRYSPYLSSTNPILVEGWVDFSDDGQRTLILEKAMPLIKPNSGDEIEPRSCENPHNKPKTVSLSRVKIKAPTQSSVIQVY